MFPWKKPCKQIIINKSWEYLGRNPGCSCFSLINVCQGGVRGRTRFFLEVPRSRTRGIGRKRCTECSMWRKNFFAVQRLRLSREDVESHSQEIFQNCLDTVLCPVLWPSWSREVAPDEPLWCLPTWPILEFCETLIPWFHPCTTFCTVPAQLFVGQCSGAGQGIDPAE